MPVRLGPMTVAQLIDKLGKLPPTAFVHSGIIGTLLKPSMEEMAEFTVVIRWPEADTPGMDKRRERLRELIRIHGETRDE